MEGELKAGDLAARLEVIQASTANETVERDVPDNIRAEKEPIVAQSYSTSETIVDPWRRTVSQLSLGSALEPEMNTGDVTGPFYDRHRVYLVSVPSQVLIHSFKTDHQTF
jgi:hypothetical protein